jgi:hypothetical protein
MRLNTDKLVTHYDVHETIRHLISLPVAKNSAKYAKNGSKTTKNGSKTAKNGAKMTENDAKLSENGSKMTKNGEISSKTGEIASKTGETPYEKPYFSLFRAEKESRGVSLLRPVPPDRSCEDALVPMALCQVGWQWLGGSGLLGWFDVGYTLVKKWAKSEHY